MQASSCATTVLQLNIFSYHATFIAATTVSCFIIQLFVQLLHSSTYSVFYLMVQPMVQLLHLKQKTTTFNYIFLPYHATFCTATKAVSSDEDNCTSVSTMFLYFLWLFYFPVWTMLDKYIHIPVFFRTDIMFNYIQPNHATSCATIILSTIFFLIMHLSVKLLHLATVSCNVFCCDYIPLYCTISYNIVQVRLVHLVR
jgi:hypothetical protein